MKRAQFTRKQKKPVLPVSATGSSCASEIHLILSLSDHRLQGFCRINLCLVYIEQGCLQVLLSVHVHNMELHPAHLPSLCYVVSEEPRGLKKAENICCY